MEKEQLSQKQDHNSIKLIRGQRGSYGFEIKLIGEDEKQIMKRLKIINDELVNVYIELNLEKENNDK